LKYSLNILNNFNAFFQSRNILIHKLYDSSKQLVFQFAQNFVNLDVLNDIFILNLNDQKNIKHIDNVYVGSECEINK